MADALPYDQRPIDDRPVHTADLPPTPVRDRNIPADAWIEAPDALLRLGDDLGRPDITYKRRLGPWLLWRAGPAAHAEARYLAIDATEVEPEQHRRRRLERGPRERVVATVPHDRAEVAGC